MGRRRRYSAIGIILGILFSIGYEVAIADTLYEYDRNGNRTATYRTIGNNTYKYDRNGNRVGTYKDTGRMIMMYDKNGNYSGSYRKEYGKKNN